MAISDERLTRSTSVGRLQAKRLLSVASREVNRGRVALRESAQLKTTADEQCAADGVARQVVNVKLAEAKPGRVPQSQQQQRRRILPTLGPRGKGCISGTQEEKVSPTRRDKSTRDADKGPHLLVSAVGNCYSRH